MIDRISFKNYKIFKDEQTIDLQPITVIFGKNNSGKSAIAKLPTLIEGMLQAKNTQVLATRNGDVELCSSLRDLIYGRGLQRLEIMMHDNGEEMPNQLKVGILVDSDRGVEKPVIDLWEIPESVQLILKENTNIYEDAFTKGRYECSFDGINLLSAVPLDGAPPLAVGESLHLRLLTDFIGPIRALPQRDMRLSIAYTADTKSGAKGVAAYDLLIADAQTADQKLLKQVSDWYTKNFEGWQVGVNTTRAPVFYIEITRGDLAINIVDAGIGMSQVLPIVCRAFAPAVPDQLIIIEEPETHLHPGAHGNLAELIATTAQEQGKHYLIETHSQSFILRLRRLVTEGRLRPSDVALYYVDFLEDTNQSAIKAITIDDDGRVSYWPEGIFGEALDEALAIRTAQINKHHVD